MFYHILSTFILVTSVQTQINGEFWWLNSKLNNLKKVHPDPPKFEVSDFQNDESAIIFRDDDLFTNKLKPIRDRTSKVNSKNENLDSANKVVWPTDEHMKNHDVEVIDNRNNSKVTEEIKSSKIQNKYEDVLVFVYPKNEKYVTENVNKGNTETMQSTSASTQSILKETVTASSITEIFVNADHLSTTTKSKESQNICTYTKKKKCNQLNGFVYEYARRVPNTSGDEPLVCCILPIQPILDTDNLSQTIHFSRTDSNLNRYKRSDSGTNNALKQRDFLLKQKFSTQRQNIKPLSTPITKIVTPPEDDYVDPYWNIKNTKFQNPTKHNVENTKYDYYSEDYVQEYVDELPKPGLIGLYSDHAKSPSSWSHSVGNKGFSYGGSDDDYEEDEDDDDSFGYSTIDPRQGNKKQKQRGKPVKLATNSDEVIYDAESHTINFQSNPDFHVFEGFKLLNLFRNSSRIHTNNRRKMTNKNQREEVLVSRPEDSEELDEFISENQLFAACGKVAKEINDRGNQVGEAVSGSHPWMALVVLTKTRHNILCYATLVHPRAAITVGDCVEGTAPGDITVVAGLWDLSDRSRSKNRVATVHVHPRYKAGDAENNLAVLHWMQPLKLSALIQPACLDEPHIGDDCKFFGWGGLDQGIQHPRSRWQRATVRACTSRLNAKTLSRTLGEPFCVSTPRGTVTGMGGPLICEIGGHSSIVGVVVSRDNGYVLSPVREWAMKTANLISGD